MWGILDLMVNFWDASQPVTTTIILFFLHLGDGLLRKPEKGLKSTAWSWTWVPVETRASKWVSRDAKAAM